MNLFDENQNKYGARKAKNVSHTRSLTIPCIARWIRFLMKYTTAQGRKYWIQLVRPGWFDRRGVQEGPCQGRRQA